jgi:hypothetical protein
VENHCFQAYIEVDEHQWKGVLMKNMIGRLRGQIFSTRVDHLCINKMVTQLFVMKDKEAKLTKTGHGEHKDVPKGSKVQTLGNPSNDNNFSSSSIVPLNVEENLDISMFDGQINTKDLNNWLK